MSGQDGSANDSMPLPVAAANIKIEPLEPSECSQNTALLDQEILKNIKLEIAKLKQEIKLEPKMEMDDDETCSNASTNKNEYKYINPAAKGAQVQITHAPKRPARTPQQQQQRRIRKAMKRALKVMREDYQLHTESSASSTTGTFGNGPRHYGAQIQTPEHVFSRNLIAVLEILDMPAEFNYDDVWNLLKDCNSSQILKVTIENGPLSKNIVKIYFRTKWACKTVQRKLTGAMVNGKILKMKFNVEREQSSNTIPGNPNEPVTTPAVTKKVRTHPGSNQGGAADKFESTDSDSDCMEPGAKRLYRQKKNPLPWRPDLDVYEIDPAGLYGLKPEFLLSLNITPPLNPWVLVMSFRCSKSELKEVMDLAGEVIICNVNHSPKFANVMYKHPLEAVQAVSMLNGQMFYGQKLIVEIDGNPPASNPLPNGLGGIGPGLGIYGKPLKDVVRHYERFVKKQTCLVDRHAFQPLDKILPSEVIVVEDEEDKLNNKPAKTISEETPIKTETENDANGNNETENPPKTPEQNEGNLDPPQTPEQNESGEPDQNMESAIHTQSQDDEENVDTDDPNDQNQSQDDEENLETDNENNENTQSDIAGEQNQIDAQSDDIDHNIDEQNSQCSQTDTVDENTNSENLEHSEQCSQDSDNLTDAPKDKTNSESIEISDTSPSSDESQNDSDSSDSDNQTESLHNSIVELTNSIGNQYSGPSSLVGKNHLSTPNPNLNVSGSVMNQSSSPVGSFVGQTSSQNVIRPNSSQTRFNTPISSQNIAQNRSLGPQNFGPSVMPQNIPNRSTGPMGPRPQNGPGFNVGGPCGPRMSGPMSGPISRPMGPQIGPGPMRMPSSNPSPISGPNVIPARMRGPNPGPRMTGPTSVPLSRPTGGSMQRPGPNGPMRMPAQPVSQGFTVQLSNLPLTTPFPMLCEKMAACGQVTSLQLTSPGCAVVSYAQFAQAKACWQLYNDTMLQGNVVTVTFL